MLHGMVGCSVLGNLLECPIFRVRGCPQNAKTDTPVRKISTLAQLPLPLTVRHTINFEKIRSFCIKKWRTSVSEDELPFPGPHWTNFPLTADVFYGTPLKYCDILNKIFGFKSLLYFESAIPSLHLLCYIHTGD